MYFFSIIRQILREMSARKWRSLLALFGIVWGTTTVVLLLSLGSGFKDAFQKNQMALAEGTIFVIPGTTTKSYQGFPKGRPIHMKADTAINIKNVVPNIQAVSPLFIQKAAFTANKKTFNETLFGVGARAFPLQKVEVTTGSRFINPIDISHKNRVALIGYKIREQLFGNENVIDQTLFINNIPFKIVGEVPNPGKDARVWYDDNVVIPYTSYINLFGDTDLSFFIFMPDADANPEIVKKNMQQYFANKYHYDKTDDEAIRIQDTTAFFMFFKYFLIGIEIFLGICGGLTLAVGALGVANIMFLIVRERTKEIGIRMAVGARDSHILLQILLESLVIIGLGGLIGFLISASVIALLNHIGMPNWLGSPKISYSVVIATVSILSLLGFLAGYFPAKRASKMDPVEALGF